MRPGDNCLRCHNPNAKVGAPTWSAAGTIFPMQDARSSEGVEDVSVFLKDSAGTVVEALVTNSAGNFYTDKPLPDPFFVEIEYMSERIEMPCAPPAGSCNACHSSFPTGDAKGRIFIPQSRAATSGSFDCKAWDSGRGVGRVTSESM
jgi:hypothetical protein